MQQESEMQFTVCKSTFAEVFPLWRDELWPGRRSEIRATSSLMLGGGYDLKYHDSQPTFWVARDDHGNIVGVNSGSGTQPQEYRSRGLYVREAARRQGVAVALLKATLEQALAERCKLIWSLPRLSSLPVYKKAGFATVGDLVCKDMEFGPNIFVQKTL